MEHIETPRTPAAPLGTDAARSTGAEHRARAEWLVAELRRMAAGTDNPVERANLKRSADSLIRLATAYRP